jgi:hypothetical protein
MLDANRFRHSVFDVGAVSCGSADLQQTTHLTN